MDSKTLSRLFNTYCTNIYGNPLWKHFDRKLLEPFYIAWRKCIRRVWKIPFTLHNVLLPYIHNTIAFNVILEKRCIKFLWTLFNSGYDIFRTIIKNSLHNRNTTLGENARYFMHKHIMFLLIAGFILLQAYKNLSLFMTILAKKS